MSDYTGCPDQRFGHITYSQHGDDVMIANLFNLMGLTNPSWLDLGAHHPFNISNTALLYAKGCSGVNVEANPILIEDFKLFRPRDKNINVGVGPEPGAMTFYMYGHTHGRNTFSLEEVNAMNKRMVVQKEIELQVMTLTQIVDTFCDGKYPDLLLTDIEGWDYAVLKTADFSAYRPKVIVTEIRKPEADRMEDLMHSFDYHLYCRMGENLFFVHTDYLDFVY